LSAASALVSIQDLQSRSESVLLASEEADAIKRQAIEQTMERLPHGARRLAVQLRTPIKEAVLWEVLTDYDHLSDFIPNLASSTVVARKEKRVQLNQVGSQQLLGLRFSAQVQLELVEDRAKGQLKFHMIKGDFRRFEGNWIMRDLDRGTSLLYELTVQGCVGMPVGLIEQRLRDDLAANLLAVEKEALRRQTLV
jgi:ribosome-associated toxin RatA of RatAB toxin-antitoxin module